MAKHSLLNDDMANQWYDYTKNNDLHPAVRSICYAIWCMNKVHPTSQAQLIHMIDAYNWLQTAIQDIARCDQAKC